MDFKVNKKKGESKDSPLRYVYFFLLLVFRGHIAFDIEAVSYTHLFMVPSVQMAKIHACSRHDCL